jgi:hypothetical protein
MRLVDLAQAEGFQFDPAYQRASLVRAMLANFKIGILHRHIATDKARAYFNEVVVHADHLVVNADGDRLHVDQVYRAMVKAFEKHRSRNFFSRLPQPTRHLDKKAVSFQPHTAFDFWLKPTVAQHAVLEPYVSNIVRLIEALKNPANWLANATIAERGDVLWLTPFDGQVKEHIERAARQHQLTQLPDLAATRLRELLGLVRRHRGEHAISIITREPLGRVSGPDRRGPFAPTIFDARSYERFRHWPLPDGAEPDHVGRTYDLSRAARLAAEAGGHGVPEVICEPMSIADVGTVVYLGTITVTEDAEAGDDAAEWRARAEADYEYAEELSAGADVASLVGWLGERLGL